MTGIAACGDDDQGPSKTAYIEKADAACAAADPKLDEIFRKVGPEPNGERAQAVLRELAPEERKLLAELRALEKPEADQDEIDRIWAARERGVEALEAAARSPASALTYVETDELEGYEEASLLAGTYGMVNCEAAHPGSVAAP